MHTQNHNKNSRHLTNHETLEEHLDSNEWDDLYHHPSLNFSAEIILHVTITPN